MIKYSRFYRGCAIKQEQNTSVLINSSFQRQQYLRHLKPMCAWKTEYLVYPFPASLILACIMRSPWVGRGFIRFGLKSDHVPEACMAHQPQNHHNQLQLQPLPCHTELETVILVDIQYVYCSKSQKWSNTHCYSTAFWLVAFINWHQYSLDPPQ